MNQQIVNLRGIAILMVMLGHSIIIYDTTFELLTTDVQMPLFEALKHWISFVQMKLFISISGFLLAYKYLKISKTGRRIHILTFAKDKAVRLLIPYLFVCFFYNDPIKLLLNIQGYENPISVVIEQLLGTNCAHLWYLPCLFLLMIMCYPLFCWASKSIWKHGMLFTGFLGINYLSGRLPMYYQMNEAGYYLVFFHIGYLVNLYSQVYTEKIKKRAHGGRELIILLFATILGFSISRITSIGFDVYLSIVIILLFYRLTPSLSNNFINEISKRSYGLYLFHSPLIYFTALLCPNINPWLMLFINFICFGSTAYLITIMLSKSKLRFIIGEK